MTDDRASGIRVRVRRKNLDGEYMIIPNALLRGEGEYRCLEPYERLLLGAGLSCDDGWDTTLGDIEEWLPGLGRDKHRRIRRRLREEGFLSMTRTQIPAGQVDAGKFIWTLAFFMEPLEPQQRDELPALKAKTAKAPAADALKTRASDGEQETAGQPMTGFPGHRSPGHRQPGPGNQGDVYKDEKNKSLKENPPSPPEDPDTDDDAAAVTKGGESPRFDEATQLLLAAAVADARQLRTRWSEDAIRKAMLQALDSGRDPESVAWAIVHAARDKTTRVPSRITSDGWWNVAELERHVTAPGAVPAELRCQKPGHLAEVAERCSICLSDERDAERQAARDRKAAAAAAAEVEAAGQGGDGEAGEVAGVSAAERARQVARDAHRRVKSRTLV